MVDGLEGEVPCHELNNGSESFEAGTDGETGEAGLRDGRIDDAVGTVAVPHAFGNFVGTIILGDFLTDEENVGVTLNFVAHGGVDCLTHCHLLVGD